MEYHAKANCNDLMGAEFLKRDYEHKQIVMREKFLPRKLVSLKKLKEWLKLLLTKIKLESQGALIALTDRKIILFQTNL